MHDIPGRMARLGLDLLGHGDAALVWGRPDEPFVVKAGWDGADAWPAWAAWCRANPGPHVPLIHCCHVIAHEGRPQGFVAVVERLWPSTALVELLAGDRRLKRQPLVLARLLEAAHPSVATMLRRAVAAFPAAEWDAAPSNWMMRADQTLVLSDPLSRAG